MSAFHPKRSHGEPPVPEAFEQWLSERLAGAADTPTLPPHVRESVLGSPRGHMVPGARPRRRVLMWGLVAAMALLLSFAGNGRIGTFAFTPVEAGIQRIGSAIVTREHFDTEGQLENRFVIHYHDRKFRIDDENRIIIASPTRYWELDRKRNVYRQEVRPNGASRLRDYFALPEIKQLNGDPVVPRDDPSTPDTNDVILQGFDPFGNRITVRVDRETRLAQDWTVEVNTPRGWLRTMSGRIEYGAPIDQKLFTPAPPAGSRPTMSEEEQRRVIRRLENEAVRRTLAGKPFVLRDVFRNSQGDLFLLISADSKFQKGLLSYRWEGEGSAGLATTLHSVTADDPFATEGPHSLRFPEEWSIVDWMAAIPGRVRDDAYLRLRVEYMEMTEPGAPPVNESTLIDIGELPRSTELVPDWMDLAASPLSVDDYWAHRAIALASKGGKKDAPYNLKALNEALARLPKPIGVPACRLFLAQGKTFGLLGRRQEALEAFDRADRAIPYDKSFLKEVQKEREAVLKSSAALR